MELIKNIFKSKKDAWVQEPINANKVKIFIQKFTKPDTNASFEDWENANCLFGRPNPYYNLVKGVEEKNKWFKVFWFYLRVNIILTVIFGLIDLAINTKTLVDMITKSFNLINFIYYVALSLQFYYYTKHYYSTLFWLKGLHESDDCAFQQIIEASNGQEKLKLSLAWSIMVTKFLNTSLPFLVAIIFILLPVSLFLLTGNLESLIPFPIKIFFIDNQSIIGVMIHVINQESAALFGLYCMTIASNAMFIFIIHTYAYANILEDFLKGHKTVQGQYPKLWLKNFVTVTEELKRMLTETYQITSASLYFFVQVCYFSIVVLWLAIKIEPGLLFLSVTCMATVIVLLIIIIIVENIKSKYLYLGECLYDLPWYEWNTNDQKLIIPILGFLQRPPALVAVVDELTLQWFTSFLKAAYSTGTVMAELT